MKIDTKTSAHCKNNAEEMRDLLIRATGATNYVQAEQRGEILTIMHQLEAKIIEFRKTDNDDKFLNQIDSKIRGLLDSVDSVDEITRKAPYRQGLFWR